MEVGLGPCDFVLHGDPSPRTKRGTEPRPQFSVHVHCGQTAGWIKMTVRPMLSDHCPVCLSVCNVGVLWPNGCMDRDETWHACKTLPWPHCVRWGPSSPSPKRGGAPQFSARVCVAKWLHELRCHLVWREASAHVTLC